MLSGLEDLQGYDFYQQSLEVDPSFHQTETEFKISRFEKRVSMSEEDKRKLRDNAPPEPDFAVMPESKVKKMNYIRRKRYKRKVDAYRAKRTAWENDLEKGGTYAEVINRTNARVAEAEEEEQRRQERLRRKAESDQRVAAAKGKDKQPLYGDIKATPADMDAALMRMSIEENAKKEKVIGAGEVDDAILPCPAAEYQKRRNAFSAYVNGRYVDMNDYLRKGEKNSTGDNAVFMGHNVYELADLMKEMMTTVRINRDIVVRRGVGGIDTMSFMLDGGKSRNMTQEQLIDELRRSFAQGAVLTDKGFVSTSIRSNAGFPAGYKDPQAMGIEFVILVRKGTRALDVAGVGFMGQAMNEEELIIGNGTKFRVVRAFFKDGKDGQQPDDGDNPGHILKGAQKCWKIYLETIPESETGVLRSVA